MCRGILRRMLRKEPKIPMVHLWERNYLSLLTTWICHRWTLWLITFHLLLGYIHTKYNKMTKACCIYEIAHLRACKFAVYISCLNELPCLPEWLENSVDFSNWRSFLPFSFKTMLIYRFLGCFELKNLTAKRKVSFYLQKSILLMGGKGVQYSWCLIYLCSFWAKINNFDLGVRGNSGMHCSYYATQSLVRLNVILVTA